MLLVENPKIAIIGSGGIGGYVGTRFALSGQEPHFLLRGDFELVSKKGLEVRYQDASIDRAESVNSYRVASQIGPVDLLIICIKTTGNSALPELIRPMLKENTVLLTLQNGLGNVAFLEKSFPSHKVLGGLCFIGAYRESPGVIVNFNKSRGYIVVGDPCGEVTPLLEQVESLINKSGIRCETIASFQQALWKKLLWNIPFNGLTIVGGGITTEDIMQSDSLRGLAVELMKEVQYAANKLNYPIEDEFIDFMLEMTLPLGAYKPSTMLDYFSGNDVELEAIWGEALRQGRNAGLELPRLSMLYDLLSGMLEQRKKNL